MASHRKSSRYSLPSIGLRAAACAAAAPLAMLIGGTGVAMADTGNTGGQTAPCHESTCVPVNAGVNAPINVNAPDLLHDGIGILDAVHIHR